MALTRYHNIVGSTQATVSLIDIGSRVDNINSIMITNVHASNEATVSLFLQNSPADSTPSSFHILHDIAIPAKTSLLLDDKSLLSFNNTANGFGLQITVGSSDTVDVLIN